MSKTFVFERFDLCCCGAYDIGHIGSSDGKYVLAQDAIDREAVLQAHIRVLETQLKEAKAK